MTSFAVFTASSRKPLGPSLSLTPGHGFKSYNSCCLEISQLCFPFGRGYSCSNQKWCLNRLSSSASLLSYLDFNDYYCIGLNDEILTLAHFKCFSCITNLVAWTHPSWHQGRLFLMNIAWQVAFTPWSQESWSCYTHCCVFIECDCQVGLY